MKPDLQRQFCTHMVKRAPPPAVHDLEVDTTNQTDRNGIVLGVGRCESGENVRPGEPAVWTGVIFASAERFTEVQEETHDVSDSTLVALVKRGVQSALSGCYAIDSIVEERSYIINTPQGTFAPGAAILAESQHPGGELAILCVAGKDDAAEFDMNYASCVGEKDAWRCRQRQGQQGQEVGLACYFRQVWCGCQFGFLVRPEDGSFRRHAKSPPGASMRSVTRILQEMSLSVVEHGNGVQGARRLQRLRDCLHLFVLERLWILGEHGRLLVGLRSFWSLELSSGLMSGQLSSAVTGLMTLTMTAMYLFQFRFARTGQYFLGSPPNLVN